MTGVTARPQFVMMAASIPDWDQIQMKQIVTALGAAVFGLVLATAAANAADLAKPTGPVVLTVSGDIAVTNGDGVARFDMAMLQALPVDEVKTTTIWTKGPQDFKGVPLKALLDLLGVKSGNLKATAINDYAVDIPVDSVKDTVPLVAYSDDGKPMSVREKGPLWIVYPYDSSADYRSELVYTRSIWQLDRIVVGK
jgi:hypothetical protein